jgi:uncharacterized membrane protein YqaE (UPF0057 family)
MKKNLLYLLVLLLFISFLSSPVAAMAPAALPSPETNPVTAFHNAVKEFRHLPRAEKKSRLKEVKKQLKEFKKQKRAGAERPEKAVLIILAILLPPLAVYLHQQEINNKFWISLVLTLLFWLPGVIYALVVVLDADS